ncbi:MAG: hypothetical protein L6R35_005400 [Caloplaca aegaea]|nr:MAG: hypothetical protein L6R35_005400 [Caloplaca aegaea]
MATEKNNQHKIWLVALDNALFRAPIPRNEPLSVLDVGAGSGAWALECASRFPNAHILGIDLSPVKPNYPVPKNCAFRVHDAETEWEFGDAGPFDLIHSRILVMGMRDWRTYFRKCYDHLKPGGCVEVHETVFPYYSADPSVPSNTPYVRWSHLILEALAKGGIDGAAAREFPKMLEEVGFEDVVEEKLPWAVGPWSQDEKQKQIGAMQGANMQNAVQGISMTVLTKNLGWTREEVDGLLEEIKKDIDDPTRKYLNDL